MRIIGIDPGYAICGYGVIETDGARLKVLDYGVIETHKSQPFADRLLTIADEVEAILAKWKPEVMAVEELFFAQNKTTAMATAHARGAIITAGARQAVEVFEYTPAQVKKAVTGMGRAEKEQVQMMVKVLLNLETVPKPDDAADALAIAICQGLTGRMKSYEAYAGYQKKNNRGRGGGRI